MARELSRKYNIAHRSVTVNVEDDFGHVTAHTIPLTGDVCPHCQSIIPGTKGSPDIEASVAAILKSTRQITDDLIAKLEAMEHPEIRQIVERAKARRG